MKKNIGYLKENECYGCSACQHSCGVKAIDMKQNREGFWYPVVNEDLCIECGRCEKVCPAINGKNTENEKKPDVYALWAPDSVRLSGSASGGAFVMLAEVILEEGGVVCGVVMDENFKVYHTIADSRKGIEPIRGSKYVQSDLRQVFPEIKAYLKEGRKVLFTGTPCQVAGLKNYIGKHDENLIVVDLICHGPTSQLVFDKYLEENFGKENVESFKFRPKAYGYTGFMNETKLKNGTTYVGHKDYDSLQAGLNLNLCVRQTCANCVYAAVPRIGDFSMGDFWGIGNYKQELRSEIGTSVLLVNNEKARVMVEKVAAKCKMFEKTPLEAATKKNRFRPKAKEHPGRARLFEMLPYMPFNKAVKYAMEDRYDVGVVGVWNNFAAESAYAGLKHILNQEGLSVMQIDVEKAEDLQIYNHYCDAFVMGPQDIWGGNTTIVQKKNLFLDFVRDEKKKISIASWCTELPVDANRIVLGKLFNRFDAVSTMDRGSMDVVDDGVAAGGGTLILDPVLIAGKEGFAELVKEDEVERPAYLLNYLTAPSEEKIENARKLAEKWNLKLVHILEGLNEEPAEIAGEVLKDLTFAKWLGYMKNSAYVVTDDLHAVSVAVMYEKQFVFSGKRRRDGKKSYSLLKMLGLEKRMIMKGDELAELAQQLENIDYAVVNQALEPEKKRSLEWISNAMSAEKKGMVYQAYDSCLTSVKPEAERSAKLAGSNQRVKKLKWLKNIIIKKWNTLKENE